MKASFEPKNKEPQRCVSHKESHSAIAYPSRTFVQAKLEMTSPDDLEEQEADAVANEVINGGKIARQISGGSGSSGIAVPRQMESRLLHSQGGGQPMPHGLRSMMESGFGQQFSQVRLHADAEAADLSSSIGAKAFTYGNDIFFNHGQYSPYSSSGQHLLAHELTHVLQQGGKVARKMNEDEKTKRQEEVLIHQSFFSDAQIVIPLIKYLCPKVDDVLIACYIDALFRAEEFFTFRFGAWEDNLEAFGRQSQVGFIPRELISKNDYMKAIAKYHLEKIKGKIRGSNGVELGRMHGLEYQVAAYDAIQRNDADETLPSIIRAIENEFLWYSIGENDPQTLRENKYKRPDNLPETWIFTAGFVGMLVVPFLVAGGIAAGGAASAYVTTLKASGKLAKLFEFLNSPAGRLLISTVKNAGKKGYDVFMDSPENRAREGYARDQFIDLGADLFLDTLDVSILGDIDNGYVKAIFKTVVKTGFDTLYNATKGESPGIKDVQALVEGILKDVVGETKLPAPLKRAIVVSATTLLGWLFGLATAHLTSIAEYEKPMHARQTGPTPVLDFVRENNANLGLFEGYLGLLRDVAGK